MISEIGLVVAVQKGTITVQMTRSSACSRCGACKPWGDQEILVEANNSIGATVGDRVRLDMKPGLFMKALAILYGLPFTAIMLGFIIGALIGGALVGFIAGIAMAALAYKFIRITEPKRQEKGHRAIAVEIVV